MRVAAMIHLREAVNTMVDEHNNSMALRVALEEPETDCIEAHIGLAPG